MILNSKQAKEFEELTEKLAEISKTINFSSLDIENLQVNALEMFPRPNAKEVSEALKKVIESLKNE